MILFLVSEEKSRSAPEFGANCPGAHCLPGKICQNNGRSGMPHSRENLSAEQMRSVSSKRCFRKRRRQLVGRRGTFQNASKLRQKCVKNPCGGEHLLDDTENVSKTKENGVRTRCAAVVNHYAIVNLLRRANLLRGGLFSTAGSLG